MSEVSLSASTRNALLTTQRSYSLLSKIQGRLESGKAVNTPVDDAIKYYAAKGLSDRATDFLALKDNINQRIELMQAGHECLTTASKVYKQMKGLVQSAKTATGDTARTLSTQWKGLLGQLGSLATDSSYQGENSVIPDPDPYPSTFDPNTYWSHPKDVGQPPIKAKTSLDGSGEPFLRGHSPLMM